MAPGTLTRSAHDETVHVSAKRIGIIGGGAAGLATARILQEANGMHPQTQPFQSIAILERRGLLGGVWNYTPEAQCCYNVPQDCADNAKLDGYDERDTQTGNYTTPIYNDLSTNLPKDVMQFPGFPFPDDVPYFPNHRQVLDYVNAYIDKHSLGSYAQLNTEVRSLTFDNGTMEWKCCVRRLGSDPVLEEMLTFDAVVLCTGRVTHPHIPKVPGLSELASRWPDRVIHAKEYRRALDFAGQDVLVVGGASSGSDISRMLSFAARNVHLSITDPGSAPADSLAPTTGLGCNPDNQPVKHPRIQEIVVETAGGDDGSDIPEGRIVFTDGTEMPLPHKIIYATGYMSVYPFIRSSSDLAHGSICTSQTELLPFTDGHIINDTYKHLVYINNPTLGILGIPFKIVPFQLYEYQALFLASVFQGALLLPPVEQMREEWASFVSSKPRKQLNEMGLRQVEYQNDIIDQVNSLLKEPHRLTRVPESWIDKRRRTFELRRKHLGY
ncbi:monooxygenase [Dipsacomyces acuminosporus]|nr:monooxygenase [Dipsacomyces acuminosporus]